MGRSARALVCGLICVRRLFPGGWGVWERRETQNEEGCGRVEDEGWIKLK